MKTLSTILFFAISTLSIANTQTTTLISKQAKKVDGFSVAKNGPISECNYSVQINQYDDQQELVIYLNSEEKAQTYIALRLRVNDVPLHDGVILSDKGNEVKYENGVLYYKKSQVDDGPFHNDYKIMQLKVSRDLKTIETAYLKDVFKNVIRQKTDGEMNCQF